jgi:histone deacetylase 1/2
MVQGYAVNVPLCDGLCDDMFLETAFKPVMEEVILRFDPQVVVLQSGADSIASDKIGKFNLSTEGHASAGRWLREQHPNIPVMVLGGGGYTISNVARTWSYETIAMLGYRDEDIPYLCPLVRPTLPTLCASEQSCMHCATPMTV